MLYAFIVLLAISMGVRSFSINFVGTLTSVSCNYQSYTNAR